MQVRVSNISGTKIPYPSYLARLAKNLSKSEKLGPINLVFCNDDYIRSLNQKFLNLNKATDVLSFVYSEPELLGEIYISAETAKKQAPEWKNTFYQELRRLVVHGCLHLAGYNHSKAKSAKFMRLKEEFYLAQ